MEGVFMIKKYTLPQIIEKAERYCATQERCIQDVIKKCYDWKFGKEEHALVIEALLKNDYINEKRFAFAYVRSKFNFKGKGKNKIKFDLQSKRIDQEIIQEAMLQIVEEDYEEKLLKLAQQKIRTLKKEDFHKQKAKLIQFLMQKGYEYSQIKNIFNLEIVQNLFRDK